LERFFAGQQLQGTVPGAGSGVGSNASEGASGAVTATSAGHHPSASTGPALSVASIVAHAFASIPLFRSLTKTEQAVVASSLQCDKYMGGDVVLDGTKDGGPALIIGGCHVTRLAACLWSARVRSEASMRRAMVHG
jgi:uncharacterized protein YodC (DUF2158 family)